MGHRSSNWQKDLRNYVWAVTWSRVALMVTSTVALPIIECAFVNLLTGAAANANGWPLWALVVTGMLHALLGGLLIWGEISNPATNILDAMQLEEKLEDTKAELQRRSDTTKMIRSVFDTLNLQACRTVGNQPEPIGEGLGPIMKQLTCGLSTALGVASAEFTVEVYFDGEAISDPSPGVGSKVQGYLLSTRQIDRELPLQLGDRSPVEWGWGRNRPGQCTIDDDKERFFDADKPFCDLYFYRFAVVPIQGCNRASAKDFHEIRAVFTRGVA